MDSELFNRLRGYINNEAQFVENFIALSRVVPNRTDAVQLLEIANDRRVSEYIMRDLLEEYTNQSYTPTPSVPSFSGDYREVLKEQLRQAIENYRKYLIAYLYVPEEERVLRDTFFYLMGLQQANISELIALLS